MRLVINLIRGQDVASSLAILTHVDKAAKQVVQKALNSAVSNAKQKGLSEEQLYISNIRAEKGPNWKRFRAAAFGRATSILKKTTHLVVELDLKTK